MGVVLTGSLALAAEPTFHNVFRLPVNKSVPKIRSHLINKQRHPFWPFSSLTWCCAVLLHKPCSCVDVNPLGTIQVLGNADEGRGCQLFWEKALRRFNVISVTRRWVQSNFQKKKHYVTLEWPLTEKYPICENAYQYGVLDINGIPKMSCFRYCGIEQL